MSDVSSYFLPIPGPTPAGSNARYHPAFIRLESQVARLTSLAGETPEWTAVAEDATLIVTQQSKDLLAAVYATRAWFELRGLPGLHEGLLVIEHVVTDYWENCFPALERLRARRSALQWLAEGIAPRLTADDHTETGHSCAQVVQRIHVKLRPRFSAGDTGLGGLLRGFDRHSASDTTASLAAGETVTTAPPTTSAAQFLNRNAAIIRLHEIATWFLLHEPHSPVGFLAQRAAEIGNQPFQDVFRDLLANHPPAQHELWHVLGITKSVSSN